MKTLYFITDLTNSKIKLASRLIEKLPLSIFLDESSFKNTLMHNDQTKTLTINMLLQSLNLLINSNIYQNIIYWNDYQDKKDIKEITEVLDKKLIKLVSVTLITSNQLSGNLDYFSKTIINVKNKSLDKIVQEIINSENNYE